MPRRGPFLNVDGSGPNDLRMIARMVGDRLRGRSRRSPGTAPVPRVEPDRALIATPPGPGAGARLTWIGHASWLVQLEGTSLLIDPVLGDAIPVGIRRNVPAGVPPEALPSVQASLVSHNHYDHLDLPSLKRVGAPVVTGLANGRHFSSTGLAVTELDWWESTQVGPVRITYVPSQHWSRRGLRDENESLWGGFVIEGGGVKLYHSGDTAYFDGFREIGRRFPGIDAAMLPIGAYDPSWFMEKQHMNPEQATQSFIDLGARRFLAMHWGTFKLTDEPLGEPPERLRSEWQRRALDPAALGLLSIGETVLIGGGQ